MSNVDKQALRLTAEKAKDNFMPNFMFSTRDVLAMLDELEKMQAQSSKWCEAFHKAVSVGARYEERIAELEAREISLPERSSMLHRTDFHDDYQTVMAYKVSEVIAAIRAAGIRIKGE